MSAAARVGSGAGRLLRAWRTMEHEQRLAAYASIGLFVAMFLPWYQRQFFIFVSGKLQPASDSQTAWGAFSFVEAAVLLVAVGVLTLLFQRAEGKAFHLPGGDGLVIMLAGGWTSALIVWRIFDKQGGTASALHATTYGIEWGIFLALAVAISLAYAGSRIRAAHRPEPPLPGEDGPTGPGFTSPDAPRPPTPRGRADVPPERRPDPTRPAARGSDPDPQAAPPRRPRILDYDRPSAPAPAGGPTSAPAGGPTSAPAGGPTSAPAGGSASDKASGRVAPNRPAPAPAGGRDQADPPPRAARERRVGWLSAPPADRDPSAGGQSPAPPEWPAPEWPLSAPRRRPPAPRPAPGAAETRRADSGPSPTPVPADEAATIRASRRSDPPLPPSTPAAQRAQRPDEQLTTPLEREDP